MKVGDLVELKSSVLHSSVADSHMRDLHGTEPPERKKWIGLITSKHHNALKVYWFGGDNTTRKPSVNQFVLKLKVLSEL